MTLKTDGVIQAQSHSESLVVTRYKSENFWKGVGRTKPKLK